MNCKCGWSFHTKYDHTYTCPQCGARVRVKGAQRPTNPIGLGDRVAAIISKFYKPKKKCGGCLKRQQKLNELGKKLSRKK